LISENLPKSPEGMEGRPAPAPWSEGGFFMPLPSSGAYGTMKLSRNKKRLNRAKETAGCAFASQKRFTW